ncbi:MAG: hypothetical protein NTX91_04260 [candidate division SR1 bacterium]|nr:hypothetical protein [candidate division SR1 bacterium]
MKNKEWFLASIGAISQASIYFSKELNIPTIGYILQIIVFLILFFLILIILYKLYIFILVHFDVTIATYATQKAIDEKRITPENDKAKIIYDYILDNGRSFIVSNRLFGDVEHGDKKLLYLTYFIRGKGRNTVIKENEKISFLRELFGLSPKNRKRRPFDHNA